jgi:hypothetical protein
VLLQRQDYLRLPRWEELVDELFLEIDESFVEINAVRGAALPAIPIAVTSSGISIVCRLSKRTSSRPASDSLSSSTT